tara:strand:- start:178 stop:741 length:564 start_codon:yes stop_codon:yes gene_type:complete
MSKLGRWFWAPRREPENWAQTLVRVLGNIFRDVISAFVILVVVALVGWGISGLWQATFDETKFVTARVSHRATSSVKLETGIDICNEDYPLGVYVENKSSKSLESVSISIIARERGSTENVLPWDEDSVVLKNIVPPMYSFFTCYRYKTALQRQDLVYSGEVSRYSVKLVEPEDWHFKETQGVPIKK